eukprot:2389383-Rhodomonas_salina.1
MACAVRWRSPPSREWILLFVVLSLFSRAGSEGVQRRCLILFRTCRARRDLEAGAQWADDSEFAYQYLGVGEVEDYCMLRASDWHARCENAELEPVWARFSPTGETKRYPPNVEMGAHHGWADRNAFQKQDATHDPDAGSTRAAVILASLNGEHAAYSIVDEGIVGLRLQVWLKPGQRGGTQQEQHQTFTKGKHNQLRVKLHVVGPNGARLRRTWDE